MNTYNNSILKEITFIPDNFWIHLTVAEKQNWYSAKEKKRKLYKNNEINENLLVEFLKDKTSLIQSWLHFSENRKGGSKYYFTMEYNKYMFGKIGGLFSSHRIILNTGRAELACAKFIQFELKLD